MTIILSSFVKEVINVPKEIQFIIIKFVIHNYLKITSFGSMFIEQPLYPSPVCFANPLHHLTALIGINAFLDNILAETIRGLTFDESIFESKQLNKFVDFVLDKSIKIHLQTRFAIKLDELGVKLLNHGGCEYTSTVPMEELNVVDGNSLKFISFLDCDLGSLGELFEVTEDLKLLERLECLKITADSSLMVLLEEEIAQALISWRRDCNGICESEYFGHIEKRVVLSFALEYLDKYSLPASMFLSRLTDFNKNGDFEIEYHGIYASRSLGSHLLPGSHYDDITVFNLLEMKNPLDSHRLEELGHISKDTENIIMGEVEDDIPDYQLRAFTAMKCASDFIDMEVQYVNSGFSFKHVGSLRKVSLMDSTISYECLNSLPDTLEIACV
ncbi:unnamed protein product [Ambrosiozyma monospora]|uniref:Unnamed protein product n=1 Tax=Ambrosiozyma monospora TaxID=43982 RepID=A0ACB5TC86_AMBMO|nr:unnamed protein product [Ambrosiozyma monospora]